jgi:cytidylate kinase
VPPDARIIDTTHLTQQQVVNEIVSHVRARQAI